MTDPADLLPSIATRAAFARFLEALRADRAAAAEQSRAGPPAEWGPSPRGWENWTLEDFLEGMHAYLLDAELPGPPDWQAFAQLLLAGKAYE